MADNEIQRSPRLPEQTPPITESVMNDIMPRSTTLPPHEQFGPGQSQRQIVQRENEFDFGQMYVEQLYPQESREPQKPKDQPKEKPPGSLFSHELPSELPYPLDKMNIPREELEAIRDEIAVKGKDPAPELAKLMKDNRVVGIGEMHLTPNPVRDFGAQIMKSLKENGATHLALEIPTGTQPVLDEYMKTGKLDREKLPALLQDDDFEAILKAARDNGIKIVAVDLNRGPNDERRAPSDGPRWTRDQEMASNIGDILEKDPNNKVVFWVGAQHLNRSPEGSLSKGAAELIGEKYSIATVSSTWDAHTTDALTNLTRDIQRPTIINTKEAEKTGNLSTGPLENPPVQYYKDWDYNIIWPSKK